MNIQAESNRLTGCQDMDRESFRQELLMALENAFEAGKSHGKGLPMFEDDKYKEAR